LAQHDRRLLPGLELVLKSTQIVIIGSGPAGLMLSQLLHLSGIESIVLERQTRAHVEGRIRAGVLEHGTVEAMCDAGVASRLEMKGLRHEGFDLAFDGDRHRINLFGLTGKTVTVYGQTEVTRDLIEARLAAGGQIIFEASDATPLDITSDKPRVMYTHDGKTHEIACDFVAGCDGFHGVSRQTIPQDVRREFERVYPFGWLGILADVPPVADELIYANGERGFALCSMRSQTRSRYYIQCSMDEKLENWPDDAIWDELANRIGSDAAKTLTRGPSIEKSIAQLRSFVCEPMRHGKLFLAGDAAHIVPPTGAKGLNLAIADVRLLHRAFESWYKGNDAGRLDGYSTTALARVWKGERFSWYLSMMMHRFPEHSPFEQKMQRAEFDYVKSSEAASRTIAENYVGLPLD
jgi:p-hydroxybenzoate 3-monooxygenase